jgi:adenylate cyclase
MAFRLEGCNRPLKSDLAMGRASHDLACRCASVLSPFQSHLQQIKGYEEPVPVYAGTFAQLGEFLQPKDQHQNAGDTIGPTG